MARILRHPRYDMPRLIKGALHCNAAGHHSDSAVLTHPLVSNDESNQNTAKELIVYSLTTDKP